MYLRLAPCLFPTGNWRKSLQGSLESQRVDPGNVKAYFRGAKAALHLGQYPVCRQQCEAGRAADEDGKAAAQFSALSKVWGWGREWGRPSAVRLQTQDLRY